MTFAQLTRLQNDSLITGYQILPVSSKTKDLDSRFSDRLHALELDVEGQLVRSLVLRGRAFTLWTAVADSPRPAVFKLMAEPFESFASEWLANCTQNGICKHSHFMSVPILISAIVVQSQLYSHLVQVLIELLNEIAKLVSELILIPLNPPLPSFEPTLGDSDEYDTQPDIVHELIVLSSSIYDATLHWLNHDALGNITQGIAIDLQSNRDMDRRKAIFVEVILNVDLALQLFLPEHSSIIYRSLLTTVPKTKQERQPRHDFMSRVQPSRLPLIASVYRSAPGRRGFRISGISIYVGLRREGACRYPLI